MLMKLLILAFAVSPLYVCAQDDLIRKIESNHSYVTTPSAPIPDKKAPTPKNEDPNRKYEFNTIIDLEHTSVKNQASSGTCWSYSTNSFLESEMMRMGKQPIALSEIFSAHCVYLEK